MPAVLLFPTGPTHVPRRVWCLTEPKPTGFTLRGPQRGLNRKTHSTGRADGWQKRCDSRLPGTPGARAQHVRIQGSVASGDTRPQTISVHRDATHRAPGLCGRCSRSEGRRFVRATVLGQGRRKRWHGLGAARQTSGPPPPPGGTSLRQDPGSAQPEKRRCAHLPAVTVPATLFLAALGGPCVSSAHTGHSRSVVSSGLRPRTAQDKSSSSCVAQGRHGGGHR